MNILEVLKISEEAKTAVTELINAITLQVPRGALLQPASLFFIKGIEGSIMPLDLVDPMNKVICIKAATQLASELDPEVIVFIPEIHANDLLITLETKYDSWIYRGEILADRQVKWSKKLEGSGTVPGTAPGLMQDLIKAKAHLH